jgi:TRAP-type mannitol/chloroaromatic compound transport system permease small subunit
MKVIIKTIVSSIETISIWTGKIASWLVVLLMLIISYEVAMRYIFSAPTIWGYELSMMLGGSILLMLAFVHQRDANIRVEIIYERVSTRWKALLNVIGALIFAYPCGVYFIVGAYQYMVRSYVTDEKMSLSFWYPPAAPFRTVVFASIVLLILQLTASLIRDLHILIKGEPL